ncbi:hypothetical protein AYK20_01690 [Thermoplasmatales archaeon SG8-52-1]|nr:MAG: hypothetical protein AYK20_01690 [Thermoplasmatales archaeon SG8-52-1]
MIKAIIFDWGGVLIESPSKGIISYCANYLKVDVKEFDRVYQKYKQDFQMGKISENEFWNRVSLDLGIQKPPIHSLWKDAFIASYIEKKDIFNIVSNLRKNGYKIGILSNTEMPATRFFYEQNYNLFDNIVFSCNVGVKKPDSQIYKIILKKLHIQPKEAVIIDDREENIVGANNVGMNAILFINKNQLLKTLSFFNILAT